VDIHVDTCKDGGQSDYEVTFAVKELKRMIGSVNTLVGNQEGCVMVGGKVCSGFERTSYVLTMIQKLRKKNLANAALSAACRRQFFFEGAIQKLCAYVRVRGI
jgi:hypothetical protein